MLGMRIKCVACALNARCFSRARTATFDGKGMTVGLTNVLVGLIGTHA